MSFDYQGWLFTKFTQTINSLVAEYGNDFDIQFKVSEEQQFVEDKDKGNPNILYIVYKQLTGPTSYNIKSVSYNILIFSEQNQLEVAKAIANKFATDNNFATNYTNGSLIKHAYSQPSVLSNFNQIDVGVRSIIYIPATLQIMEGLLLLTSDGDDDYGVIKINKTGWTNAISIKYLSLAFNYSMSGDTQQFPANELATTQKSTASASLSIVIPLYNNDFCRDVLNIAKGSLSGNTTYNVNFYLGNIEFNLNMKVISSQLDDAPDQAPGLRIGMMI